MNAIAQSHHATSALRAAIAHARELMTQRNVHPARTVVLLPFIHLVPVATRAWAEQAPSGFAPRFETTMTWAARTGFTAGPDDLTKDMGRDLLTARALLERAGLSSHADLLAPRLVEAAWQVAPCVAAVAPSQRAAWAANARDAVAAGLNALALMLESAVARIAVEWAAASAHPGDALFEPEQLESLDLLVVFEGLRTDALAKTLQGMLGDKAVAMPLDVPGPAGGIRLQQADDPSDEAERAAACVLRHVEAGRVPLALAAIDRVLTRRIRAMLDVRGIAIRDETGWKLSTTRAAAHVMLALRACAWNAGADAVIDWLKNSPSAHPRVVLALERRVRRAGLREWRSLQAADVGDGADQQQLLQQVNSWRDSMQGARALPQWLADLRGLLQAAGPWSALERDAAGAKVIAALRLDEGALLELRQLPQAARRLALHDFSAWVNESLEAANFIPDAPTNAEQVVILPFNQLLGRPFAALVLPGCDEVRLAPAQEPRGLWTATQRQVLGLPSREALEAEVRAGWRNVLQTPVCDVLWRASDDSGEPVLPSALVQELQLQADAAMADDARIEREVRARPTAHPLAIGQALAIKQLSASAYEDLRRCPYRFFALRQLGLQEADEIDTEVDKRDFGNWLHRVLSRFHTSLQSKPQGSVPQRSALLDEMAREVTQSMRLEDGEFLPFASAWPAARNGYLAWLALHEAQGAQFVQAESEHEMPLGPLRLLGRIDRVDRFAGGSLMVLDYKTESADTTRSRIRQPAEDTQLAFYAALLEQDSLRAAYVNVGERGKTEAMEQPLVVEARDLLIDGMLDDVRRIGDGVPLAALGEGKVCEFCSARGLCRRDFWND
jgi:ATP-dependent helicase/nuclease subunit B